MGTDEGDLTYKDLIRYLGSEENRRYAGRWVGVLEDFGGDEKRKIVMSGTTPEALRTLIRQDYRGELLDGACFSIARIPQNSSEDIEVSVFMEGL